MTSQASYKVISSELAQLQKQLEMQNRQQKRERLQQVKFQREESRIRMTQSLNLQAASRKNEAMSLYKTISNGFDAQRYERESRRQMLRSQYKTMQEQKSQYTDNSEAKGRMYLMQQQDLMRQRKYVESKNEQLRKKQQEMRNMQFEAFNRLKEKNSTAFKQQVAQDRYCEY